MTDYVYMSKEKEETFVPNYRFPTEKTHPSPENPYIFPIPGEEKPSGSQVIYLPGDKKHVVPEEVRVPAVIPEPVVRVPAPIFSEPKPVEKSTFEKKDTKKKVKKKRWFKFIPLLVSAAIIAAMGIGGHFTKNDKQNMADYVVHQMGEQVTYKSVDDIVQDTLSGLKTGDIIYMGEGQAFFHESDRVSDIYDTFGNPEGLRPAGDYKVEYFSILHNGKIAGWVNVEEAVRKGAEQHHQQVVDEVSLVEGELQSNNNTQQKQR